MNRIIYKNEDGSVGVLIPTDEALSFATIEQIAEKDVPAPRTYAVSWAENEEGEEIPTEFETYYTPYKICTSDDIPSDRTQRDAWEWDDSIEPDGFGGESNEFDAELLAAYYSVEVSEDDQD